NARVRARPASGSLREPSLGDLVRSQGDHLVVPLARRSSSNFASPHPPGVAAPLARTTVLRRGRGWGLWGGGPPRRCGCRSSVRDCDWEGSCEGRGITHLLAHFSRFFACCRGGLGE